MKRTILAIILFVSVFFTFSENAFGQTNAPIDLILLLDTSSNMSSSYDNVNNYITGAFLNDFLRVGDTFHLIAFSGSPRLDVARRISGYGDVETIIGRMLLQFPVERGNNVGSALSYAEQYITSLPSRPKKIVIVSVGYSDTNNLVTSARGRLSSRNTTLDYIQVTPGQPLTNLPSSGRQPAQRTTDTSTTSTTQGTGSVSPNQQGFTGSTAHDPSAPFGSAGTSSFDNQNIFTDDDFASASETDGFESSSTESSQWTAEHEESKELFSLPLPVIIGIILLLLLILGLILLLSSRRLSSSPNRVMAAVASSGSKSQPQQTKTDHTNDLAKYAAGSSRRTTPYDDRRLKNTPPVINPSGPLLLNLFVEEQNTAIGKRNIHSLKSGYSLSVGGGKSDDFLIFLVPIPGHIGDIRRSGSSLSFIPRKPKYFPDIGSNEVSDCINKTIRIVSDKNYEMRFRFEMYEDPLIALNRMLMSVKVPG